MGGGARREPDVCCDKQGLAGTGPKPKQKRLTPRGAGSVFTPWQSWQVTELKAWSQRRKRRSALSPRSSPAGALPRLCPGCIGKPQTSSLDGTVPTACPAGPQEGISPRSSAVPSPQQRGRGFPVVEGPQGLAGAGESPWTGTPAHWAQTLGSFRTLLTAPFLPQGQVLERHQCGNRRLGSSVSWEGRGTTG